MKRCDREMRQMEGGWLSNSAIERSKERIQRLPYVEKVEFENKPVPGSADLVDVDYNIKEGLPGQFGGGIGYSESQKFSLNGNFVHSNFMGTGDRVALEINAGKYSKSYVISHTDPYTTIDGVARTTSFTYRDVTQFVAASSAFSTKQLTAAMQWSYPITEYQYLQGGVSANKNTLVVSQGYSAQQAVDWVKSNGNTFQRDLDDTNGDGQINSLDSPYTVFGSDFYTYELTAGWNYDARNKALFADRGLHLSVSGRFALPVSDVRYYATNFQFLQYVPIWRKWLLSFNAQVDYASALGKNHVIASVSELLRRRPGQRARLSGEHARTPGQHRLGQPVRRKSSRDQPHGADIPGARKVEKRRPSELVLRHGQCVSDG